MNRGQLLAGAAFTAFFAAITGQPAMAQDAENAGVSAAADLTIADIVVTARRSNESLQDVPVAVSVVSAETIDRTGSFAPTDLTYTAPGLTATSAVGERSQVFYSIRGQSFLFGTNFPAVMTYFNEVPVKQYSAGQFFDLENIQVLRGPQGVLFGRVTDGGNVMFAPKLPTNELGGYIEGKLGNHDLRTATGVINVPIVDDTVLLRAGAEISRRDGFTKNLATGQDLDSVAYESYRAGLTIRPAEGIENTTVVSYLRSHDNGTSVAIAGINATALFNSTAGLFPLFTGVYGIDANGKVGPFSAGMTPLTAQNYVASAQAEVALQNVLGPRQVFYDFESYNKRKNLYITNTTTLDINDNLQLKAIVGYTDVEEDQASHYTGGNGFGFLTCHSNCGDGSTLPFVSEKQLSGELRLAGNALNGRLDWSVGTYWDKQDPSGQYQNNDITLGMLRRNSVFYSKTRSAAVYAFAEYDAEDFAPGLKINGGIRYTRDKINARGVVYLRPIDAPLLEPTLLAVATQGLGLAPDVAQAVVDATLEPIPYGECVTSHVGGLLSGPTGFQCQEFDGKWKVWTYQAGASYEFGPNQLVYAKISRGYRPGGVNSAITAGLPPTYDPEFDRSIELGLKLDWDLGNVPLRTNLALYRDSYTEIQQSVNVVAGGVVAALVQNVSRATVQGVELEATMRPTPDLSLGFNFAYTDAKYKRDPSTIGAPNDPCDPSLSLNVGFCTYARFLYTPKYQLSATANWTLPLAETVGEVVVGGRLYHQSSVAFGNSKLQPFSVEPKYTLLDLYVEWNEPFGAPIDASFFMNNVTNKLYRSTSDDLSSTANLGIRADIYGIPRMFGFGIRYKFGSER